MIVLPLRSTVSAPSGTGVASCAPALSIRPPRTTTTESATGGAPVASISCAPTSAMAPAPSGGGASPQPVNVKASPAASRSRLIGSLASLGPSTPPAQVVPDVYSGLNPALPAGLPRGCSDAAGGRLSATFCRRLRGFRRRRQPSRRQLDDPAVAGPLTVSGCLVQRSNVEVMFCRQAFPIGADFVDDLVVLHATSPDSSSGVQIIGGSRPINRHFRSIWPRIVAFARCLKFHVNKYSIPPVTATAMCRASRAAFAGRGPCWTRISARSAAVSLSWMTAIPASAARRRSASSESPAAASETTNSDT